MKNFGTPAAGVLLIASAIGCTVPGAATAQSEPATVERPAYRLEFSNTPPGNTPQGAEWRRRLSDPVEREKVRAENRTYLEMMYPELAQALGIDAALEAKIIDLFTDRQMEHLDRFWAERADPTMNDLHEQQQDTDNQIKQRLQELLGEERYDQYLDYKDTVNERRQMLYYEKGLAAGDELTSDQKQRLMVVLRAQRDADLDRRRAGGSLDPFGAPLMYPSPAAMQRRNVELNEENFRTMQRDSQVLLQQLRPILRPQQFTAYAELEKSKLASQRKWVQEMRVSAGMPAAFDETKPPATPAKRTPIVGKVKLELYLTVDDAPPANVTIVTENGKAAAGLQAPRGLWAVPTPTLYEDGWVQFTMDFYEERGGQRRRLEGGINMGMRQSLPDNRPLGYGGNRSTLDGSKTFAVTTNVRVTRAE